MRLLLVVCLAAAAYGASLSRRQLSLDDAFNAYDANGDGSISQDEVAAFMAANGYNDNASEDQEMIEGDDFNGDHVVDKEELAQIYNALSQGAKRRRQIDENSAFGAYDSNGDGSISDVEVEDVIGKLDLISDDASVAAAIANADSNGDGSVSRDEFDVVFNAVASLDESTLPEGDAFGQYDANGDGLITLDEFKAFLSGNGYDASNDGADAGMIASLDTNGDGSVDKSEFDAIYQMIVNGASKKRQLDENDAFNAYDRNQDGKIGFAETAGVIGDLGLSASDDDVNAAIANADSNGDGQVDRDEFDAMFNGLKNLDLSLDDAFNGYDANGDGSIDASEFHALLAANGASDSDGIDQEGIESADFNGDGVVDRTEFSDIYAAITGGIAKRQIDESSAFSAYDSNNDGSISDVEVEDVIGKLDLISDDASVAAAIANADSNGDGSVSRDEFDVVFNAVASLDESTLPEGDAFGQYDANGDGLITVDEFKAFLSSNGYDASNDGADAGMIASLDTNGDGSVDKSEFDAIYQMIVNGASKKRQLDENDAFNAHDRNGDGSISRSEAAGIISAVGVSADDNQLNAAFNNADANGDGSIDRSEFDAIFNAVASL